MKKVAPKFLFSAYVPLKTSETPSDLFGVVFHRSLEQLELFQHFFLLLFSRTNGKKHLHRRMFASLLHEEKHTRKFLRLFATSPSLRISSQNMKHLLFESGMFSMNLDVECEHLSEKLNQEVSGLNLFKDGENIIVYVPDDDSVFQCKLEGTQFKGTVTRNDEMFKGNIELEGMLVADNMVFGTVTGQHSEDPSVEVSGSFSLHQ